ncbi:hypothetical protein [Natronolimnobius sp. AArcel1]|uniref:hypothetical protein n=1 Tax=Natronolimnobius sp. AArcel1 TaxID=1679093 RepID=UPI0019D15F23|nr:hypothetical protein [Natronolimnobius sp. AArcel1]
MTPPPTHRNRADETATTHRNTASDRTPSSDTGATAPASAPTTAETATDSTSSETLAARLERLEAENNRLRAEYGRVRQSQYRRRALGLAAIGFVAIAGAAVFAAVRDVLLVLGATGLIGAVLTYYLAPEQFVAADIGERIYVGLANNQARLTATLGLSDRRHYVPTDTRQPGCLLVVPSYEQYQPPDTVAHDSEPIITAKDHRSLRLEPSGLGLVDAFDDALTTKRATTPDELATQLATALVEQFELAARVEPAVGPEQVTFAITDSTFGDCDRFDHPVASFLAVGLAVGLERPITLEVAAVDNRADWLLTCRFVTDEADPDNHDSAADTDHRDGNTDIDDTGVSITDR